MEHEFLPVEMEQACDIGLKSLVDNQAMIIHAIKHDERILELARIFDEEGRWNGKMIDGLTTFHRTMREVVERIGEPSQEEMGELKEAWESAEAGANPKTTVDWRMIEEKAAVESREALGSTWPLSLPGNDVSRGVVSQQLGRMKRPGWD